MKNQKIKKKKQYKLVKKRGIYFKDLILSLDNFNLLKLQLHCPKRHVHKRENQKWFCHIRNVNDNNQWYLKEKTAFQQFNKSTIFKI